MNHHSSNTASQSPVTLTSNLVVYPEGEEAVQYVLNATRISVGRGAGCQIRVHHSAISTSHLELVKNDSGEYGVFDSGSSNGLFINGEKVSQAILKDGDRLLIGGAVAAYFLILPDDAEAEDPVTVVEKPGRTAAAQFADLAERTCNLEAESKRHQRSLRKLEFEIEKVEAKLLRLQEYSDAPPLEEDDEALETTASGSKPEKPQSEQDQEQEQEQERQLELVNRITAHSNATSNTGGVKVSSGRN